MGAAHSAHAHPSHSRSGHHVSTRKPSQKLALAYNELRHTLCSGPSLPNNADVKPVNHYLKSVQDVGQSQEPKSLPYFSSTVENDLEYAAFIEHYPEYRLTWSIDVLRHSEFKRLNQTAETYVDYLGGSIYPESLVRTHAAFLQDEVLGNTHSVSNR
jgi:molybdenum cofactor sulfurtransferase